MKPRCPSLKCTLACSPGLNQRPIIRKGSYFRKSDSRFIPRFFCKSCKRFFSRSTNRSDRYQKARRITYPLMKLLNSGVSQRRAALILHVNQKTVVRRFRYLANEARLSNAAWVKAEYENHPLTEIQFDDLETSEHTKCKPLSVALAVDPKSRKILTFQVSQMPAKGLLAKRSLQKYGYRKDERSKGWDQLMRELVPVASKAVTFHSDENPHYPKFVKKYHPHATHKVVKGGRGSITGQGELKKLIFDPLFSLNHTCAMMRANLNRLFRRTWCISKTKQGLIDHLSIYMRYHNLILTPKKAHA